MEEFEYKTSNYLCKLDEEHLIITVFKNERKIGSIQNNHNIKN